MNRRFIIPFTYKNQIVGYTARWIGTPKEVAKYYNPNNQSDFVYGLDRQTRSREMVIVTEGRLDAIVTDGCATGRNNINDEQAEILKSHLIKKL